jgi:hypothetical protein
MQRYIFFFILAILSMFNSLNAQNLSNSTTNLLNNAVFFQSSEEHDEHEHHEHRNIDGSSYDCRKHRFEAVETQEQESPWWEADLLSSSRLLSVQITFSEKDYPDGLKGLYLLTSDYPMDYSDLPSLLESSYVTHIRLEENIISGQIITLNKERARYFRIQAEGRAKLSFSDVVLTGDKNVEIAGNRVDDDEDGLTDAADADIHPVFRSVAAIPASCATCNDATIHVVAGGEDLSISIDGGRTFVRMQDGLAVLPAIAGSYNLVISSGNGSTTAYERNPLTVPATGIIDAQMIFTCPLGGSFPNNFAGMTGGLGTHTDNGTSYPNNNTTISAPFHQVITSSTAADPNVPSLILTSPSGNNQFVRLGATNNANNNAQRLTYCFMVNQDNAAFNFNFAAVMWRHSTNNNPQPNTEAFFRWNVTVNGVTVGGGLFNPLNGPVQVPQDGIFVIPWTCANLNLSSFVGQTACVQFESAGCTQAGHGGYAYIDGLCERPRMPIMNMPASVCFGQPFTAFATNGQNFQSHFWSVEKVDASLNPIPGTLVTGPIQNSNSVVSPLFDVIGFWQNLSGQQANCGDRFRVTLTISGFCSGSLSRSRFVQLSCPDVGNYCNMAICNNAPALLTPQATNNCPNCEVQWSPSTGLSDPNTAFPQIQNPAALSTTYSIKFTDANGCSVARSLEVWDATLNGNLTVSSVCHDQCNVILQADFITNKTLNTNRITVRAVSDQHNLTLAFTSVTTLPGGNKRYKFSSQPFENKGAFPNWNTPEAFTVTIATTTPPGFCNQGNCPSSISTNFSLPRGIFHGIPNIYLPNVFWPNAPNPLDQTFWPGFSLGTPEPGVYFMRMKVFDLWGGLMYDSGDWNLNPTCSTTQGYVGNESGFGWNGYKKDKKCNQGVYTYIITYGNCTNEYLVAGDVLLLW